ncbi:MAG TPA: branched-chain amino acid ABC transporter substrate-binding protein, partial [Burkholderiales bacterium]|nr:branched-chain amino acid ABC transporter substrate-binding protein [Burkholderiales bacterium]
MKPISSKGAVRLAAAGAAAVIAFGLAGCGKKEESAGGSSGSSVQPVVKIGHAAPLTGGIAHLGKDNENGVRLAIDEANAKGLTIGGQKVAFEMLTEDDEGKENKGPIIAQKFVDAKVAGVVGHLNSGVTIPASEIYNKAGIPVISGSATNPVLTDRNMKGVFRTVGRDDQQGPAIAAYIAGELKAKTVALVDDKTAYGEGLAN